MFVVVPCSVTSIAKCCAAVVSPALAEADGAGGVALGAAEATEGAVGVAVATGDVSAGACFAPPHAPHASAATAHAIHSSAHVTER